MSNEKIVNLLNQAIEAGSKCSVKLADLFDDLDTALSTEGKESVLRYYFDCWADAVNHDFMVYDTKDPQEWTEAAIELRNWYINEESSLTNRTLWDEALPKNV